MNSNVSDMLSQQQQNLQQLHSLQQQTKSITSREQSLFYGNQQPQQQVSTPYSQQQSQFYPQQPQPQVNHQSTPYPLDNYSPADNFQNPQQQQPQPQPQPQTSVTTATLTSAPRQSNSFTNARTLDHLLQQQQVQTSSLTSASALNRPRTSMQSQRTNQQQDPRSPLVVLMPSTANPTEVLAQRFAAWRSVIRSILVYMTETVSIQDEIVRQQLRLSHAVNFPFFATENQHQPTTAEEKAIQKFFLPLGNGSIQDLPSILTQYHSQMASAASKASKELTNEVLPRLEDLRRDLLVKIKEIKGLQSDFKNSCNKELQQTKQDLKGFQDSIEEARYGTARQDPYLAKIILDKQIKRQLTEENFLHEAFNNLQSSGRELEKVVVMEIQNALTIYARILGQEAQLVFDILISKLDMGFFNKEPIFEWDNFVSKDPNFVEPDLPMRHMKDIVYRNQFDPLTNEVKSGFLERRSKFLKSYSKGFYVLTPSFLHEFKTGDRKKDLVPVMSLSLNDCTVAEHSKKGSSDHKFILHAKQNGIIHRGHNWVFRAESYESMMSWFNDIKKLTSTANPLEKANFVSQKLNLDNNGRPKNRNSVASSIRQPRQSSFPPNLDENTNTNTTVSIPDTNYKDGMVRPQSPINPQVDESQQMQPQTYTGNIYVETSGNAGISVPTSSASKREVQRSPSQYMSSPQQPRTSQQYSLQETSSKIV